MASLCDEGSELHESLRAEDVPWPSWRAARLELVAWLAEVPDFFRQVGARRHFIWLFNWFSLGRPRGIFDSTCPIGVLALRLFTVLLSNDADRCIQLRDAGLGIEVMSIPFEAVLVSGWPVFNMLARLADETRRVSFPLDNACDSLDGPSAVDLRTMLLAPGWPRGGTADTSVWGGAAASYLSAFSGNSSTECPLASATAFLALAQAEYNGGDCSSMATAVEPCHVSLDRRALVAKAHHEVLRWAPLGRTVYDSITTRWPVWQLLDGLAGLPTHRGAMVPRQAVPDAELVFCGEAWIGFHHTMRKVAQRNAWRLHFLQADPRLCMPFYRKVAHSAPATSMVVLLSPLLWSWGADAENAVTSLASSVAAAAGGLQVAGFPVVSSDAHWHFHVWQMSVADWSLRIRPFPTGYQATFGDRCFETQAASGTRVFRNATLWQRLLPPPRPADDHYGVPQEHALELDLAAAAQGIRLHTCMARAMPEEPVTSIIGHVSEGFARRHRLDAAEALGETQHFGCDRTLLGIARQPWGTNIQSGVSLVPPCLEHDAQEALRWLSMLGSFLGDHGGGVWLEAGSLAAATLLVTAGASVLNRALPPDGVALVVHVPWVECPTEADVEVPAALILESGEKCLRIVLRSARLGVPVLEMRQSAPRPKDGFSAYRLAGEGPVSQLWLQMSERAVSDDGGLSRQNGPSQLPSTTGGLQLTIVACAASLKVQSQIEDLRVSPMLNGIGLVAIHAELAPDGSSCLRFLRSLLAEDARPNGRSAVAFLSPLLLGGTAAAVTELSLLHGLRTLGMHAAADVVGFPAIGADGRWRSNVRAVRHQYWKLVYRQPSGSARPILTGGASGTPVSNGPCLWSDAASASRLFRNWTVLEELLEHVETGEAESDWLVDMDIGSQRRKLRTVVCLTHPIHESDYLSGALLSPSLSEKHQVEVADFLGNVSERCIGGANWFQVSMKGLVAPWCFRRDVMRSFKAVTTWWSSLNPGRNFVVPEEGTFLALFRNGAAGMLPWDSDFDAKLYSESQFSPEEFMNLTKGAGFKATELEAYLYNGCGQDRYVLLRRPNITHHIGDLYIRGDQRVQEHPWRARLFGAEVRIGPDHMDHIFFRRYQTPVQKLFGDGFPLQCLHPGHNACLPDCRDDARPCEFDDDFVHVDVF